MTKILENQLETPVAFFIYRRPSLTEQSFEAIKKVRPKKLYLIADGPKGEFEQEKCELARKVVENVDWPCKVVKNYSDVNLGLRQRTVSGLNWVFEQEPEAIILEDDVVADSSFFYFGQELLEKYRDDERVFQIGATTFQRYHQAFKCFNDYYFSRIPVVYGWATWRRAWVKYDDFLESWPTLKKTFAWKNVFLSRKDQLIAKSFFEDVYRRSNKEKNYAHWSWQWIFTCLVNNGLVILPKFDLASNIGTDQDGTNVTTGSIFTNLSINSLSFPLRHPKQISINKDADSYLVSLAPSFIRSKFILFKLKWRLGWLYLLSGLGIKS